LRRQVEVGKAMMGATKSKYSFKHDKIRQNRSSNCALPYNPFGNKDNYQWSFAERWFNMKEDEVVLIGNETWDKIGGSGTYELFIKTVNQMGQKYKNRIYREFLEIEPPTNQSQLK
jgi:hypothetical protein